MATKITLRLPERLVERLREWSQTEGVSVNEAAVRALRRGLGDGDAQPDADWRVLGDLVEVPPAARLDVEELRALRQRLALSGAQGMMDELEWVRGGRE
jgi:hypothetical protein